MLTPVRRGLRSLAAKQLGSLATLSSVSRLPASKLPALTQAENIELRQRHLAPGLKTHYASSDAGPLKVAYGRGQYLFDIDGRRYLDCVNNVCHVGHCHPRIVTAASTQLGESCSKTPLFTPFGKY